MKWLAAWAVALVFFTGGAVTAQDATPLPGSSCTAPAEGTDIFVCPEFTFTKPQGSFVIPSIWVRDARYGWVRMTACDELIISCAPNYIKTATEVSDDAIEIDLDEDDTSAPSPPERS